MKANHENNHVSERNMYRQGDVALVRVDRIPSGCKAVLKELGRTILAHGEMTGHHHSFDGGEAVALLELGGERFLNVDKPADLTHQEHDTIPVVPGTYRVIRQREYDDAEEWRYVAD